MITQYENRKALNRRVSKDDTQMANKHMESCPTSSAFGETKLKTTVSYNFTPTRRTIIKRQIMTNVDENVEKLEPLCIAGTSVKWCSYFGKRAGSSSKGKQRVTMGPRLPLLTIYPREMKTYFYTKSYTGMFIAALLVTAKNPKSIN